MERVERVVRGSDLDTNTFALFRLHVWPVIAGVLVTFASALFLGAIAAAIGISAVGPSRGAHQGIGIYFVIWSLCTSFVAGLLGAWVTSVFARTPLVSDGLLHGFVVWAVSIVAMGSVFSQSLFALWPGPGGGKASMGAVLGAWGIVVGMFLLLCGTLVGGLLGARKETGERRRVIEEREPARSDVTTDVTPPLPA